METTGEWYYWEGADVRGRPSTTLVNLQFQQSDEPLRKGRPWLVLVFIERGTAEPSQTLVQLQQKTTVELLAAHFSGLFVARVDRVDGCEYWFYCKDAADPVEALRQALGSSVRVYTNVRHDPAWHSYSKEFAPHTREQAQHVMNGRLMNLFAKSGGRADKPCQLRHVLLFKDQKMLSACESILSRHGIRLAESGQIEAGDYRLQALFLEDVPQLSLPQINATTSNLLELARRADAFYDGWECAVE